MGNVPWTKLIKAEDMVGLSPNEKTDKIFVVSNWPFATFDSKNSFKSPFFGILKKAVAKDEAGKIEFQLRSEYEKVPLVQNMAEPTSPYSN